MVSSAARPVLESRRHELESLVYDRLRRSTAAHYRDADEALLRQRVASLLEAFLVALGEQPFHFGQYFHRIAEERFDEGFDLTEIQLALNVLGERSWTMICATVDEREALVEALGRTSAVIGHAKDALAQAYFERSRRAHSTLVHLRTCLDQLTQGTDFPLTVD
jgi:hypothetical protein